MDPGSRQKQETWGKSGEMLVCSCVKTNPDGASPSPGSCSSKVELVVGCWVVPGHLLRNCSLALLGVGLPDGRCLRQISPDQDFSWEE